MGRARWRNAPMQTLAIVRDFITNPLKLIPTLFSCSEKNLRARQRGPWKRCISRHFFRALKL